MSLKANLKSKAKLVRVVLASTVGSMLWAGCAQPRVAVTDPQAIAHAPADLTKRRPDTHPELRTGIWQLTPDKATADVVLSPSVRPPELSETPDESYLLGYSPEVINAVPPADQDAIIVEAAGAEVSEPRRSWRERWFRRSNPAPREALPQQPTVAPPPGGTRIERFEEREVIIESEPRSESTPLSEPYKRSSDEVESDEGGKLTNIYFVKYR